MAKGVSAAIWWQDQCLLIKRGKAPYKDHWSFPGGRVEEEESLIEALHREIQEEVGLSLSDFTEIAEQDFTPEGLDFFLTIFMTTLKLNVRPEVVASSDAIDHCWIKWDKESRSFEGLPKVITPNLMGYLEKCILSSKS